MDVIPRWVDKYRGIPFQEDGYTREGLHCWGLCVLVYADQLRIELPRYAFGAGNKRAVAQAMRDGQADFITAQEPKSFDLVLMKPIGSAIVWHIGVMVSVRHCLHIEEGTDAHCDLLSDPLMRERHPTFHRHPSLA